ncbi:zinc-dependent metalloprotease [Nocardioides hwasunensis]|uniref:Zinc-dependent metalloprotease n=1 Tax=Nocardioides hwasunensis TaxID=397258 RepID=A0ABR8MI68_9ACTN|nr:zinc-dependent metalloprotease [Nocardioides hwasunensis]MBD3915740.1 zinc-dependent metalloprotease [Nocardioides hwasunensis]
MNLVDWDFAVTVGSRIAGPGPDVSPDEAAAAVLELREGAARSTPLVGDYTGLQTRPGTAPVLVVDRPGWLRANADGFATILDPIVAKVAEKKGRPSPFAEAIGSRVTGAEVGLMLGFLGSKVLGQFDPFFAPHGRLLLVAPNIVHVEREIGADPSDFRLWVCLHEETHRVQFTANPWLGDHLLAQMQGIADTIEPSALLDGLRRGAEAIRGGNGSVLDLVSSPEQKEILDRVTGVMSLLEGHADVVMDGVGPTVIPSVKQIRKKFNRRRQGIGSLDKLLRRLLGLDAKMAQYRDGAVFVRHVVDKVGMEEFNAIWTGPETLPSKAEISDPDAWVARVL